MKENNITITPKKPEDAMTPYEIEKKLWEQKYNNQKYIFNSQLAHEIQRRMEMYNTVQQAITLLRGAKNRLRKPKYKKYRDKVVSFIKTYEDQF